MVSMCVFVMSDLIVFVVCVTVIAMMMFRKIYVIVDLSIE